jgi:hypothetical protein
MRRLLAAVLVFGSASAAFGFDVDGGQVRWDGIAGVVTALNVDNPIANIDSGTFAWTARGGHARVNLATGAAAFDVDGLVINGTIFSGTPGPVTAVTGTLVCNPGDTTQAVFDTPPVPLSARGDADFSGHIGHIPAICSNPLFLIRIAAPAGALGRWIATGTERASGDNDTNHHGSAHRFDR